MSDLVPFGSLYLQIENVSTHLKGGLTTANNNGIQDTTNTYGSLFRITTTDKDGAAYSKQWSDVSAYYYNQDGWLVIVQETENPQLVERIAGKKFVFDSKDKVTVFNFEKGIERQFDNASVQLMFEGGPTGGGVGRASFDQIHIAEDGNALPMRFVLVDVYGVPGIPKEWRVESFEQSLENTDITLKSLFTPKDDVVDFNTLSASQLRDIGQMHDAFDGNDTVHLPNYQLLSAAPIETPVKLNPSGLVWMRNTEFLAGDGNDKVFSGNDVDLVDLGKGDDEWFGSSGNDVVKGGEGNDTFNYIGSGATPFLKASFITLDGGTNDLKGAHAGDVLKLPGSSGDYVIIPNVFEARGAKYEDQETAVFSKKVYTTGVSGPTEFLYKLNEIEKIQFEYGPTNYIKLSGDNVALEMAMLSKEVYGPLPTLGHNAEGLYSQSGDYDSIQITRDAVNRGWHPVSALELGIPNAHFPGDTTIQQSVAGSKTLSYSMFAGHYQAVDLASLGSGTDKPESNAFLLTGVISGVKTLVIAFRGTDQVADFYDYQNFSMHYQKYEPLLANLAAYMQENGIAQVLATGHSLGAGMVEYFMADPRFTKFNPKAFTFGSPGSDAKLEADDPRIINFVHDEDPVARVPQIFGDAATRDGVFNQVFQQLGADVFKLELAKEIAAEIATKASSGGITAGALKVVDTKVRHGSDVTINTPVTHARQTGTGLIDLALEEHSMDLYRQDIAHLVQQSSTLGSADFKATDLAAFFRDPLGTGMPGSIQIAVGAPSQVGLMSSPYGRLIYPDSLDKFVQGNAANNYIVIEPKAVTAFFNRVIDGEGGTDTLQLPGTEADFYMSGSDLYKLMPHGTPDIFIGKLVSIERFVFTNGKSLTYSELAGRGIPDQSHELSRLATSENQPSVVEKMETAAVVAEALSASAADASNQLLDILSVIGAGPAFATGGRSKNGYASDAARSLSGVVNLASSDGSQNQAGGKDVLDASGSSSDQFSVMLENGHFVLDGSFGRKSLDGIERIAFSNGVLGLDVEGQSGLAYRLYQAAYAREPDQAGLTYWFNNMDRGMSADQVAQAYLSSAEFMKLYGSNPTAESYVTLLYKNVLGRAPDQAGLDHWRSKMAAGESRSSMLIEFSESAENKALTGSATSSGVWFDLVV